MVIGGWAKSYNAICIEVHWTNSDTAGEGKRDESAFKEESIPDAELCQRTYICTSSPFPQYFFLS
jgi:hypothetical protein